MICTRCEIEKEQDCFYKDSRRKSGFANWCKSCTKLNVTHWQRENKEARKITCKRYRENNKEKLQEVNRLRSEKMNVYGKNYRERYPDRHCARQAKRRVSKIQATPIWLTPEQEKEINNFYWLARDLSVVSCDSYHVDHIVPLRGKNVCGLHVPWNLQILPSDINLSKGNR